MQIVTFPHPTLRHPSKPIKRIDAKLRSIIHEMFDLMYESRGIGLAANQVGLPFRFFILNLKGEPEEGEEFVYLNPVLSRPKGSDEAEEGCLSFPELYGPVKRPAEIRVNAYDLNGQEINEDVDGMLARAIQHENDHLDGVLFVDRMSAGAKLETAEALEDFEIDFHSRQKTGGIPDDNAIRAEVAEWEARYC